MIDLTTLADLTPGICSVTLRAQGIDEVVRISSEAGLAGASLAVEPPPT